MRKAHGNQYGAVVPESQTVLFVLNMYIIDIARRTVLIFKSLGAGGHETRQCVEAAIQRLFAHSRLSTGAGGLFAKTFSLQPISKI